MISIYDSHSMITTVLFIIKLRFFFLDNIWIFFFLLWEESPLYNNKNFINWLETTYLINIWYQNNVSFLSKI